MKVSNAICLVLALITLAACKKDDPSPLPGVDVGDMTTDAETDTGPSEREAILAVPVDKETTIAALQAEVHVVYTAGNVPHIYARSLHDAYVAAGFIMGRDRFFEFDVASRIALGELSQLLGGLGLGADLDSRGRGTSALAKKALEAIGDEVGAEFDAMAAGLNAYAAAARAGELPAPTEYDLAAPLVRAASGAELIRDVGRREIMAFAAFAVYSSSFTDSDVTSELVAQQIPGHFAGAPLEALRQAGIEQDLFPGILPRHDISVTPGWGLNGELQMLRSLRISPGSATGRDLGPLPPSMRDRLAARVRGKHDLWFNTRDASDRGSNAWAVAADSTANGSTLVAGDGHLSLGVPTLFMQMGLDVRTFGDDPTRVVGLYLPGYPYMAVGTNGDIAWSQTYPRADVMDWYREELELDANGVPTTSLFKGTYEPLMQVDELYQLGAVLTDPAYDVVWPRWTTFDGRVLMEIEGRTVEDIETEVLAPGETIVTMGGDFIVPGDEDGDGVIAGISVDFTPFGEVPNLAASIRGLHRSKTVDEFMEHMRGFTGYAQNLIVGDSSGSIGYSNYTVTPCRGYLPRDANGDWVEGANPQRLLDGTQYGGFEVPYFNGVAATGDADPYRCMIDRAVFPRVSRATGFVANANNDPAGATFDNSLTNDPAYIGGPWVPGYRARKIVDGLEEAAARGATLEDMADIQNGQQSLVGIDYAPEVIDAVARAKASAASPAGLSAAELRAADLYTSRGGELDQAAARLQAWLDAGANPASGVDTFYDSPTDQDRTDAVATMVFNTWLRQWIAAVFADEDIDFLLTYPGRSRGAMMRALRTLVDGRGPGNPENLASWNSATEESVYFDDMTTPAFVEEHDEIAVAALIATLDYLAADSIPGPRGGFGTSDMEAWLWGLRHRVVFDSVLTSFGATPSVALIAKKFAVDTAVLPLADNIPAGDPRRALKAFPRPGDLFGVDAANPSFYGDSLDYADGPVMRMVFELSADGVRGQNVVPGGQSGLTDSPNFADQAKLWLANETLPVQWAPNDVANAAIGHEVLKP